jgi:rubrerythrin
MPWCPGCRSEYREDVEMCPTCNVALARVPPEETDEIDDTALLDSDAELAVLGRADFGTCLEMREALREKGIPCVLVREQQPESAPAHREAAVDLLVEVTRIEEAARALHERWSDLLRKEGLEPAASGDAADEELRCPACGHAVTESATECPDCGLGLGG